MSPVHVIVGEDPRAEAMWSSAFTGAVDLYRFNRNVDAFERLTAAEAPIDLVILTPAQRGPFNLTADQFIARVLEGPLGSSRCLSNLHVIVVGQTVSRSHPRVMAVSTLDAAIRLVKFGEVESAPRPEAPRLPDAHAPVAAPRASHDAVSSILQDLPFSGSVISRIWDAPDPVVAQPVPAPKPALVNPPIEHDEDPGSMPEVMGGGAPVVEAPGAEPAQLFARTAPAGFVVAPGPASAPGTTPVVGGGEVAPVGAPGESIEVATGALQPARAYHLEQAGYRGPAIRGGNVHGAGYDAGGQPVPPALASQVQSMVYGGMHVGNPHDPLLTWSSGAREQAVVAPSGAVPNAVPNVVPVAVPQQQAVRTVPMEPPAGVYAPAQPMQPAPPADPFLARAEQGGGDVAFG